MPNKSWIGARLRVGLGAEGQSGGQRVLLVILSILAIAIVASLGKFLIGVLFSDSGHMKPPPTPVRTLAVAEAEFVDTIEALGTAHANESVDITAKVTETVRHLNFTDGDAVQAGQVLVELINDEQSAELAEARASLLEAQQQFDRIAGLANKGTVSRASLDTQRAQRDSAQARVAALEARLGDRILRAPFAGVLGLRAVSPGTLVQSGSRIVTLDDVSLIKVDFSVPETFLAALAPGQEISAESAAYPDRKFTGIVRTVDSRVDPVTRTVAVRAEIPNPEGVLRPGMLLTLELIKNRRKSLAVPEQALIPIEERHYVFLDREGLAERVEVKLGKFTPENVEVLSGLKRGDRVIIEGASRVAPGRPVEEVKDDGAPPFAGGPPKPAERK